MGSSSGLICIIIILLLLGLGGPTTYVVVVREQKAQETASQGNSAASAITKSPTTTVVHDGVNGATARADVASSSTSTSSAFQTHTKAARDFFHENYFKFHEPALKNGNTFISTIRSTLQSHPGSQHDLLASLLHASCLANTPAARRLDYHTDTCPYVTDAFLSSTDIDWREIVRKNFYSVVMTSSKEHGSVGRWFCDAVFPPGWSVGARQTKLTRMVEADCEVGRMKEMEERRKDGRPVIVGDRDY